MGEGAAVSPLLLITHKVFINILKGLKCLLLPLNLPQNFWGFRFSSIECADRR